MIEYRQATFHKEAATGTVVVHTIQMENRSHNGGGFGCIICCLLRMSLFIYKEYFVIGLQFNLICCVDLFIYYDLVIGFLFYLILVI